jgi:hypothetical protein
MIEPDAEPLILRRGRSPARARRVSRDLARDHLRLDRASEVPISAFSGAGLSSMPAGPTVNMTMDGDTITREDAMKQFRAAWDEFATDPDRVQQVIDGHARATANSQSLRQLNSLWFNCNKPGVPNRNC